MNASSICFIINAKSHHVARYGSWLEQALSFAPDIRILRIADFATLGQDISAMAQQGVNTFFIEGGDGTVLAVLSACAAQADQFDTPPEFAILPGGSTNLAHKIVGFRARNARAFQKRLSAILNGTRITRVAQTALHVCCETRALPLIGFVLSTGTLTRAMCYVQREFHGEGHRGSLAIAGAICRFLIAPHKYLDRDRKPVLRGTRLVLRAKRDAEGDIAYDGAHCLSFATCLPRLSLGLYPFWGKGRGGIAITHARWPVHCFRRALMGVFLWKRAKSLEEKGFFSHRATEMALQPEDPIMLDGEILTPLPGGTVIVTLTDPIGFLR